MKKKSIGEIIKNYREVNQLSQIQLAEQLKVDEKTISRYENDKTKPRGKNLDNLCRLLNVTKDELLPRKTKHINKMFIMAVTILMITVSITFMNSKKEKIYKIQSLNPDYKVEGQVVLNGSEGYIEIENIEVLNLDKFKNVEIYDYDYYLLNSNGEIYSKKYVYGGFDSYDDPRYSYIDSINKIKFKVKIKNKDIKDEKDKYYFSINYTDAEILPQNEYIKLNITE